MKVLLVDDEIEFVNTLSNRLGMRGIKADVVHDGTEALDYVKDGEKQDGSIETKADELERKGQKKAADLLRKANTIAGFDVIKGFMSTLASAAGDTPIVISCLGEQDLGHLYRGHKQGVKRATLPFAHERERGHEHAAHDQNVQ